MCLEPDMRKVPAETPQPCLQRHGFSFANLRLLHGFTVVLLQRSQRVWMDPTQLHNLEIMLDGINPTQIKACGGRDKLVFVFDDDGDRSGIYLLVLQRLGRWYI